MMGDSDQLRTSVAEKTNKTQIYFLGQLDDGIDKLLEEIVRCEKIYSTRSKYSDKEIGDYLLIASIKKLNN